MSSCFIKILWLHIDIIKEVTFILYLFKGRAQRRPEECVCRAHDCWSLWGDKSKESKEVSAVWFNLLSFYCYIMLFPISCLWFVRSHDSHKTQWMDIVNSDEKYCVCLLFIVSCSKDRNSSSVPKSSAASLSSKCILTEKKPHTVSDDLKHAATP